jgi:hypothetical protein
MPQARDAKQRCSWGPRRGLSPSRFMSNLGIVQLLRSGVEHMPFMFWHCLTLVKCPSPSPIMVAALHCIVPQQANS